MENLAEPDLVIAECKAAGLDHVYVVGSFSKGVSFLTQQLRALNLVWALFSGRHISETSRVAVVGAGLAGLTAAAAFADRGCEVLLIEESDEIMHRQAGSVLRFVHPHAHLWPTAKASTSITSLPFLNWRAGTADNVRKSVTKQFETFRDRIDVRLATSVSAISSERGKPVITFSTPRFWRESCDCILVTVGFGLENLRRSHPYWEPDGLAYAVWTRQRIEWLVSGSGDGGLVDVMRLRFRDFNYGEVLSTLLSDPSSERLAAEVLNVESAASKFGNITDRGGFLFSEYGSIAENLAQPLADKLRGTLRNDTHVHLVSPHPTPFSTPAMPINRFLAAVLFVHDSSHGLEYHQGRCRDEDVHETHDGYIVRLSDTPVQSDPISCTRILFRHGPKPAVDRVLPETVNRKFREGKQAETFPSRMAMDQLWPTEFYTSIRGEEPDSAVPLVANPASFRPLSPPKIGPLYCGTRVRLKDSSGFSTLTCAVVLPGGQVGFLCSAHGLGPVDQRQIGREVEALFEDEHFETVASLYSMVRRTDSLAVANYVDAAASLILPSCSITQAFHPRYNLPKLRGTRPPRIGERVFKVGAASGLTRGQVFVVQLSVLIRFETGQSLFENAIGITSDSSEYFSKAGDSGALVVAEDGSPLAVVFAFDGVQNLTYAYSLYAALNTLSCRLVES